MSAINGTLYAAFATTGTIATAVASTDRLYSCKSATLKVDIDLPDVSTKESAAWAQHITGLKNWSIDFNGVWDEAGSATQVTFSEIMALIIAGNVSAKYCFIPAALGVSIPGWKGMGSWKGLTVTGDMEQGCTFSGSVVGNGALILFDS
jgi:hypothetical protein